MSTADQDIAKAQMEGRRAAEKDRPHTDNPHTWKSWELHLAWFESWFVARVEREDNCKLQVGVPQKEETP